MNVNISVSAPCVVTVGGQVNGSRLCEVLVAGLDYLCHTFPFLFSILSLTFLWSNIDLSSTMMMGWGSANKETAPQWDNYAENECGEIVFVSLTATTLLTHCIFAPYSRDKTQIKYKNQENNTKGTPFICLKNSKCNKRNTGNEDKWCFHKSDPVL